MEYHEIARARNFSITASAFRRRLSSGGADTEVELPNGVARWLPAQDHSGENIGQTETHVFFAELKEAPVAPDESAKFPGPTEA